MRPTATKPITGRSRSRKWDWDTSRCVSIIGVCAFFLSFFFLLIILFTDSSNIFYASTTTLMRPTTTKPITGRSRSRKRAWDMSWHVSIIGSDCHGLCYPHGSRVGYGLHLCDSQLTCTLSTGWREPAANPQQTHLQKNAVAGLGYFILFHVLLILTNIFCLFGFYLCLTTTGSIWLGGDEKNGPKQRVRRVVWAKGRWFLFYSMFYSF